MLRPNDEDRVRYFRLKRLQAGMHGASCALLVMLFLGSAPLPIYALITLLGAAAGMIAFMASDTSWSWMPAMLVVGIPMGWGQGLLMVCIMTAAMAGAGWIIGLSREIGL